MSPEAHRRHRCRGAARRPTVGRLGASNPGSLPIDFPPPRRASTRALVSRAPQAATGASRRPPPRAITVNPGSQSEPRFQSPFFGTIRPQTVDLMTEATAEDRAPGRMSLAEYARAVEAGWTKDELMRAILHELPRRLERLTPEERTRVLTERPPLTATRWDALIAATAEHVAGLHGLSPPAWTDEPERFVDLPWVLPEPELDDMRQDALWYAPAAFIRHGVLPDPRDLDRRGGERHDWVA